MSIHQIPGQPADQDAILPETARARPDDAAPRPQDDLTATAAAAAEADPALDDEQTAAGGARAAAAAGLSPADAAADVLVLAAAPPRAGQGAEAAALPALGAGLLIPEAPLAEGPAGKAGDAPADPGAWIDRREYIPDDPLFASQWHLRNTAAGQLDLNLTRVWDDYTGAGVFVAVGDDGVDRTHEDLAGNYSTARDWDFADGDTDASPALAADMHGTAVAGIIGANDNAVGGVGVAFGANIFGFRLNFNSGTNDDFLNNMIASTSYASGTAGGGSYQADVVNMSYGTSGTSVFFDSVYNQALMAQVNAAFNAGVVSGRGGLGTIYVASAGNGRVQNLDSAATSWKANPVTIEVAAVLRDGFVSSYSAHGANVLVSAFGSPIPGEIVTTDRTGSAGYSSGNYTSSFNGTSAAAPQISGVVAVMLEANSGLGWRDVQSILALSARHVGTAIGGGISGNEEYAWQFNNAGHWNGGGMHFSNDYGFGLADALAAVRLAEVWTRIGTAQTSSNRFSAVEDLINAAETIDGVVYGGDTNATSGSESYTWSEGTNVRIEHVTIELDLQTTYIGDLVITITSPNGTTHQVINNIGGSLDLNQRYLFSTNAFWGETSAGQWTVTITDSFGGDELILYDLDFAAWGSTVSTADHFILTNEFSDYAGTFGHGTSFDGGAGVDTLNTVAVTSSVLIDLLNNSGTVDGVAISNSDIQQVFTGDGNDTIIGDDFSTLLDGGRGNDDIAGGSGNETLYGGAGNDTLSGRGGLDVMYGGNGSDTFHYVNGQGALYGEALYGGAGTDRLLVQGAGTFDFGAGSNGFDVDSIEKIEFYAESNTSKTIVLSNKELDSSSEFATNLLIDGNYNLGADDTIIVNVDFGNNLDISGWLFQDWFRDSVNQDLIIINGNSVANLIQATSQADSIFGGGGNDTIHGNDGNDTIEGGLGGDSIYGGGGDDVVLGDGSIDGDMYDGGAGIDTYDVSHRSWAVDVTIDLAAGIWSYSAGSEQVLNFENISGSNNLAGTVETLRGNSAANLINGNGGADRIEGGSGADTLYGGAGSDTIDGGSGGDQINGGGGNDLVIGDSSINGDVYDGGGGVDTYDVSHMSWVVDVTIDLAAGIWSYSAGSEQVLNFENINGSNNFSGTVETLRGNNAANLINGNGGADSILGGGGSDLLRGGAGADTLSGEGDDDALYGGADNDLLFGGQGEDLLRGEAGNDTLRGGGIRDLLYGGAQADLLQGDGGNDLLVGGGGADTLHGGEGNDRLVGGTGKDVLFGGAGADQFVFRSAAEAGAGGGRDVIGDFESGIDKINLSAMQAGLSFIGTAGFTGVAGQVRFNKAQGLVMGDLNGDGAADFAIEVTGVASLSASDFIL
ncbi:S8 family serine peptidase [Ruixingdingia sedimenti]|uniref:S8 family serine peptidase n=1 Tax=Ruixingdingia sedimenti TaxID=3073604 RepID=A0ABU1FC80_9RHOB|nr:S8 family serine peptidase [Xinfangfangia sp. LG-4]MDR5654446.1 S8 family serine peptidase [Xinfangfangia sp. LG-4]